MRRKQALEIGPRLREARLQAGRTQGEVAKEIAVTRQAVSAWERGATQPSVYELRRLVLYYGTSADAILFGVRSIPLGSPMLAKILGAQGAEDRATG